MGLLRPDCSDLGGVIFQNDMCISAAKAKTVNADHDAACGGQSRVLGDNLQVPILKRDFGIGVFEVDRRGYGAVLDAEQGLD